MKRLQKTLMYLFIATAVAFTSCSPEDGADGMDGAPGEQGIAGQDGQNGEDGAANITSLLFDASSFSGDFTDITIPELTSEMLSNGAILSYLTDDGSNWVAIPTPYDSYQFDFAVQVVYSEQFMTLDYTDETGAALNILEGDLLELRVVLIEGSNSGRSVMNNAGESVLAELKKKGIDVNNYGEVAAYLNLD
jgi:hypothetical protein